MNTKKRVAGGKQPSAFLRTAGGHFGKKLVVGEKCPVCGSVHHPESAKFKETAISEDDFSWGGGSSAIVRSLWRIYLDHPVVFLQIQPVPAIFTFTAVKQRQACAAGIAAVHIYVVDTLCQRTDALDETKIKVSLFLTYPAVFVFGQQQPCFYL